MMLYRHSTAIALKFFIISNSKLQSKLTKVTQVKHFLEYLHFVSFSSVIITEYILTAHTVIFTFIVPYDINLCTLNK